MNTPICPDCGLDGDGFVCDPARPECPYDVPVTAPVPPEQARDGRGEEALFASLLSRAHAYDDAVQALAEVRGGGPLSTTIGHLIRAGYLVPADPHRRCCARCGDAVQYLSSYDLCDGCSATHTSTPLRGAK